MRLFHGTGEAAARRIMKEGILPRDDGPSNWEAESRKDLVYLTNAYAPYFADAARQPGERLAIIEVEVDEGELLPDEDFLEQASRRSGPCPLSEVQERTYWYRDLLERFAHHARDSLEHLGNACCYKVGADAVVQASFVDMRELPALRQLNDPMICLLNYELYGARYRALTRALTGHDVTVSELLDDLPIPGAQERRRAVRDDLRRLPDVRQTMRWL